MAASNPMGYGHGMPGGHMGGMPHPISQAQPGELTVFAALQDLNLANIRSNKNFLTNMIILLCSF